MAQTLNYKDLNVNSENSTYIYVEDEQSIYKRDQMKNGRKFYHCIESDCKCRGVIYDQKFTRTNPLVNHSVHNHKHKAEFEIVYNSLKARVAIEKRQLHEMHKEALRSLSIEASGMLAWPKVRHTLQRIRRKMMPPCNSFETMINLLENDDLVFENFGKLRESNFYQGTINDEIMVFANMELIGELGESIQIFVDGTFNVTPFKMGQLLIVLAELRGTPRPILYAIMGRAKEEDYMYLFEFIKDSIISQDGTVRRPRTGLTDFEIPMRRAIEKVWPEIILSGCNFHYCQALRRRALKIQELSTKITKATYHHKILNMFMRLSLLPLDRVETGLRKLEQCITSMDLDDDFEEFLTYFHRTWIVLYKKEEWNVFNLDRRSNNNIEGYNRKVKQYIRRNPSPWLFLEAISDLAYDASASYQYDYHREITHIVDRSQLSGPLNQALIELNSGNIDELKFLEIMANLTHKNGDMNFDQLFLINE